MKTLPGLNNWLNSSDSLVLKYRLRKGLAKGSASVIVVDRVISTSTKIVSFDHWQSSKCENAPRDPHTKLNFTVGTDDVI